MQMENSFSSLMNLWGFLPGLGGDQASGAKEIQNKTQIRCPPPFHRNYSFYFTIFTLYSTISPSLLGVCLLRMSFGLIVEICIFVPSVVDINNNFIWPGGVLKQNSAAYLSNWASFEKGAKQTWKFNVWRTRSARCPVWRYLSKKQNKTIPCRLKADLHGCERTDVWKTDSSTDIISLLDGVWGKHLSFPLSRSEAEGDCC